MSIKELNEMNLSRLMIWEVALLCRRYNVRAVCNDGRLVKFLPVNSEDA